MKRKGPKSYFNWFWPVWWVSQWETWSFHANKKIANLLADHGQIKGPNRHVLRIHYMHNMEGISVGIWVLWDLQKSPNQRKKFLLSTKDLRIEREIGRYMTRPSMNVWYRPSPIYVWVRQDSWVAGGWIINEVRFWRVEYEFHQSISMALYGWVGPLWYYWEV